LSESIKGEIKTCATTVNSIVDFVNEIYPNNKWITYFYSDEALSLKNGERIILKEITEAKNCEKNSITCHSYYSSEDKTPYYFCHAISNTKLFKVNVSNISKTVNTYLVAMCHYDTQYWAPEHQSFAELKILPGEPVCHFAPYNDLSFCSLE